MTKQTKPFLWARHLCIFNYFSIYVRHHSIIIGIHILKKLLPITDNVILKNYLQNQGLHDIMGQKYVMPTKTVLPLHA